MAEVIYIDDLKENLHQTEFCHSRADVHCHSRDTQHCHSRAGGNPSPHQHSARAEMGPRLRGDDTNECGDDTQHCHSRDTPHCHSRVGGNPSPNKHSARAEMGPRLRGDDTNECGDDTVGRGEDTVGRGDDTVGRGEDKVKHTHDNQDLNNLFQTFMHQTNNKLQSIQKDFQQQLSHYVLKVVSQLFLEHVETPKAIELMITRALQEVSHYPEIMVHMHPRDIELLSLRKLHIKPDARQNLKFVADETLILGGVKIHTPQGILDASLETQIQRLKNAVLKIRDAHYV